MLTRKLTASLIALSLALPVSHGRALAAGSDWSEALDASAKTCRVLTQMGDNEDLATTGLSFFAASVSNVSSFFTPRNSTIALGTVAAAIGVHYLWKWWFYSTPSSGEPVSSSLTPQHPVFQQQPEPPSQSVPDQAASSSVSSASDALVAPVVVPAPVTVAQQSQSPTRLPVFHVADDSLADSDATHVTYRHDFNEITFKNLLARSQALLDMISAANGQTYKTDLLSSNPSDAPSSAASAQWTRDGDQMWVLDIHVPGKTRTLRLTQEYYQLAHHTSSMIGEALGRFDPNSQDAYTDTYLTQKFFEDKTLQDTDPLATVISDVLSLLKSKNYYFCCKTVKKTLKSGSAEKETYVCVVAFPYDEKRKEVITNQNGVTPLFSLTYGNTRGGNRLNTVFNTIKTSYIALGTGVVPDSPTGSVCSFRSRASDDSLLNSFLVDATTQDGSSSSSSSGFSLANSLASSAAASASQLRPTTAPLISLSARIPNDGVPSLLTSSGAPESEQLGVPRGSSKRVTRPDAASASSAGTSAAASASSASTSAAASATRTQGKTPNTETNRTAVLQELLNSSSAFVQTGPNRFHFNVNRSDQDISRLESGQESDNTTRN